LALKASGAQEGGGGGTEELLLVEVMRGPAALLDACKIGNVQRLQRLLDSANVNTQDPNPNGRHSSLLHLAAGYNHLKVAELLLANGARTQTRDNGGLVPLHNAASYGVIFLLYFRL
jgi:ankyrin repeat protein